MASASIGRSVGSRVTNTRLGSLGRIGFGCYRIFDVPDHLQLLETALVADAKKRINLVDTSANYGDGQSETVVGKVISKLSLEARKQLCIVSKGKQATPTNTLRYINNNGRTTMNSWLHTRIQLAAIPVSKEQLR